MDAGIAISGMGAATGYGAGVESLWRGIERGADCLRPIERFPIDGLAPPLAGALPPWPGELPAGHEDRFRDLCVLAAVSAAREAWADARADGAGVPPDRVALVVGTSTQGDSLGLDEQTRRMARELGAAGPCIGIGTVCCASTSALGLGRDLLENGRADLVLAGGAEALTPELVAGFHALGLLSRERCAPFSEPFGTTLAEGAGFVVLETWERAVRRGVRPHAALLGYGLSSDAFHETGPDPSGAGVARAIRMALADAALAGSEVGYVNAHGTGTQANDAAEWRALQAALGPRAAEIPVSSSKGHLGHAQSAAGALELIVTLLAMGRGVVPPTLHFRAPRAGAPADPVGQAAPRPAAFDVALSTNSAMAGANAAVLVTREAGRRPRPRRRPIHAAGSAAVGLDGRAVDLRQVVPSADPRGLDPSGVLVTGAAALSLKAAGIKLAGPLKERTGLFLGNSRLSPATMAEFRASIAERGLARMSTAAFARRMLSAPAGACAKALSLRGPTTTLATGAGEALVAIACAAALLERREDVDVLLAGGVVERWGPGSGDERTEGAAFLALRGGAEGAGSAEDVLLAGWGLAGPDRGAEAVEQALAGAGVRPSEVEATFQQWPRSPGFDAVLACEAVRRGEARVALALAGEGAGGAATCALLFTRPELR